MQRKIVCLLIILIAIASLFKLPAFAEDLKDTDNKQVIVKFFLGRECPHCAIMDTFLNEMQSKYSSIAIKRYEVFHNTKNATVLNQILASNNVKFEGVPVIVINEQIFSGFDENVKNDIENYLSEHVNKDKTSVIEDKQALQIQTSNSSKSGELKTSKKDKPGTSVKNNTTEPNSSRYATENKQVKARNIKIQKDNAEKTVPVAKINEKASLGGIKSNVPDANIIKVSGKGNSAKVNEKIAVPFLGQVDPLKVSLPVLTIVIAIVDSFNPCAFFVLISMLGLLVNAKSREKILVAGGIFVLISGLIYFMFMAAWLNLFLVLGSLSFITIIAGLVSLLIGIINIKDFFWFKKGISLSISRKNEMELFGRFRKLIKVSSYAGIAFSSIILAITANSYELLCTAGFPLIYTRVLTLNKLQTAEYYFYLMLYNVIYIIPLLIIMLIFAVTLGKFKISERQGRVLKVISGTMMFVLGVILLSQPKLLGNLTATIGIILGSVILGLAAGWLDKNFKFRN